MSNPIIAANTNIGQIAAEADDTFLFECFVDHPALADVQENSSPKMILLGGTGSGKTAVLRMVERQNESAKFLELDELSLSYLSNSDVIDFLKALDVPLTHFFQALWKHIICIEYIKLKFRVRDEQTSKNFWQRIQRKFQRDSARQKALDYLQRWENRFWISFEDSVVEITASLEKEITGNAGAELDRFKLDAGFARKLSEEKKSHLQRRLKKYVDSRLLAELANVINLLADFDRDEQEKFYILIDRLDEEWVGVGIRYQLIRSLIEALKSMRRIEDLKVIVSLRSDMYEKVLRETEYDGFQAEKYEDYSVRLKWVPDELRKVVNSRINALYKRQYTKDNIFIEDIFPRKVGKTNFFPYILDRTSLRPRDVISFVNFCLAQAGGSTVVDERDVRIAERHYSQGRLDAMIDEWRSVYPAIGQCLKLLKGKRASFELAEIYTTRTISELFELLYEDDRYKKDELVRLVGEAVNRGDDSLLNQIIEEVVSRMYLVGAIGLNTEPQAPIQWFYKTNRKLPEGSISTANKVRIHPMLHTALGVQN